MMHRYITAVHRINRTEPAIFVSLMCSLFPEDFHSDLILSSLQLVVRRVAAVKRLPVYYHSADYIFWGRVNEKLFKMVKVT